MLLKKVRIPLLNRVISLPVPRGGKAARLERAERHFEAISFDITNHCNARCPFCFNDWESIKPCVMTAATLEKGLQLLPLASKKGFYFSCLYEPTIHPEFASCLRAIPDGYRERLFFTTNLVRRLTEDELLAMAQARVGHINISIETLDAQKHLMLAGVKNSAFHENLKGLADVFSQTPEAPKVRFVTMILRPNREELCNIVRQMEAMFPGCGHELCAPYFFSRKDGSTIDSKLLLTKAEYEKTIEELLALGKPLEIGAPFTLEGYEDIMSSTEEEQRKEEGGVGLGI